MDHLIYLFAAVVVISGALASIAVWAPRSLWIKASAVVLFALLMSTAYAGFVDLLSKPKSVTMEWVMTSVPEASVLAATMRERQAIYLWIKFDDIPEPRAYVLPWSLETAKQLQRAMRQAQANGTGVRMRRPFEANTESSELVFYAEPQPALPPKGSNGV